MRGRTTAEGGVFIATFNSKNRTVSDRHLTEIFVDAEGRYGYDDMAAKFAALTDFKIRWQRLYSWIRFTASDCLDRAPDDVLRNLAEILYAKIGGEDGEYNEAFIRHITGTPLRLNAAGERFP